MFGKGIPSQRATLKFSLVGALVVLAGLVSPLWGQGAGFPVEIDPPVAIQGNEPITFTVIEPNPATFVSFRWIDGNSGDVLGTEISITLDPDFVEPTPILVEVEDVNGDTGRGICFVETGNSPVGFAVFVDPSFVIQGDKPFTLTARTTHPREIVSYEWRNDLTDEILGTTESITLDPDFDEPTPISVKLTDDMDQVGYGSSFVETGSGGPNGFFVLVEPPFAIQGDDPIVFEASLPGIEAETFEWRRADTGDVLGTEQTLTLQPEFETTTDITVDVTDTNGNSGRGFATVFVGGTGPSLLQVHIDPPVVAQGDEPIELTAMVHPENTVVTSYRWINDQTGEVLGDSHTLTLDPVYTEPTVISCEITSDQNQTAIGCTLILPDGSNIPGVGVSIDPPVILQEDEPMVFTAVPGEGITPESFEWRNLNTGQVLGTGESITLDPNFSEVTTIGVEMTDTESNTYRAESLIIVDPIGPPLLGVIIDPPIIVQEDEPMTFTAQTNGSGTALTYEWVREDTGDVIGTEASVTLQPDFEQTTSIVVTVTDAQDRSGQAFALVVVGDRLEPWVMVDPPVAHQEDETMTFTAIVADGHTAADFAWFNENTGDPLGTTQSITLDPDFEVFTSIRVEVTDTEGEQSQAYAIIIVDNIPNLFDVSVNPPLFVQTDQPIELEAVIPPDVESPEFEWMDLSTREVVGTTQAITLDPEFENSTTIGVTVTAADGSQGFAYSLIVVSDIAASFILEVDPPIVNQGVNPIQLSAIAPDGLSVSDYEWFNEETGASLGTGETITILETFQFPTLVRVEATDGDGGLGVGYALILVSPAGPDPNGDGENTLADLMHELPNWNISLTVKELMMINIGL